ncbi:YciI family protein [Pelagibacterium montanilacus]|uniref:YciI family protein n=1 Tax=Pelagibacterium montanilacus TaxID=2185280 RepID=UPI000F8CADE1|nr:YciI family protein [Pelagibacterium montanilacus]
MLYAILCYNDETVVGTWSEAEDRKVMDDLMAVQKPLAEAGKLGPVARLLPTTAATTLRKTAGEPLVLDGPFAETKEQFLGFYVVDCETLDEVVTIVRDLARANPGTGSYEIRPVSFFNPGSATP